ncbi:MAG: peptide deformylase, partial [Gammaproteobacteria bacterium]|nr:peptide deformylase [Gammaproteobacteria bacterium]
MAILNILHFPDPRLRNRAKTVETVDDSVRKLVDDMFETMYAAPGIGLAATQVDDARQVIVIDISDEHDQPLCLINPEILESAGEESMD